jgi:hypothetical protein
MNIRLKKRIFDRLYEVLKDAEIIDCGDSIWFIDRDKEYWYLEYKKRIGKLYWRYKFFTEFFQLFGTEQNEFNTFIKPWVEEVLNCKVKTAHTEPPIVEYTWLWCK